MEKMIKALLEKFKTNEVLDMNSMFPFIFIF